MRSFAAVGVHDDFPSCESCVPVRTSDDEFPGRVHMKDIVILEKCRRLRVQFFYQHRYQYVLHIFPDLCLHGGVHPVLSVLVAGLPVCHVSEFFRYELVMLGGYYDGVHSYRFARISVVFYSELGLGVWAQVWHQFRHFLTYPRKYLQGLMRKRQWQGHIFIRVTACIAEHHSLVSGSLLFRVGYIYAPVYVLALLVQGGEHSA